MMVLSSLKSRLAIRCCSPMGIDIKLGGDEYALLSEKDILAVVD